MAACCRNIKCHCSDLAGHHSETPALLLWTTASTGHSHVTSGAVSRQMQGHTWSPAHTPQQLEARPQPSAECCRSSSSQGQQAIHASSRDHRADLRARQQVTPPVQVADGAGGREVAVERWRGFRAWGLQRRRRRRRGVGAATRVRYAERRRNQCLGPLQQLRQLPPTLQRRVVVLLKSQKKSSHFATESGSDEHASGWHSGRPATWRQAMFDSACAVSGCPEHAQADQVSTSRLWAGSQELAPGLVQGMWTAVGAGRRCYRAAPHLLRRPLSAAAVPLLAWPRPGRRMDSAAGNAAAGVAPGGGRRITR